MRIIAGEFRGRILLPPAGQDTRPITDRAKQSVFDILQPNLERANVYDCFAGTGSMGLECLSRGGQSATFFESDPSAVQILKKNIQALKLEDRSRVVSNDIFKWSRIYATPAELVDVLFLDPPYRFLTERADELRTLMEHLQAHLSAEAICIFRHDAADSLELPGFEQFDLRDYGQMRVEFLRPFLRPPERDTILP